jgi:Alw26I/Eco31I/Esp3I family type II restriction m6 adenine DNA methyltransferase
LVSRSVFRDHWSDFPSESPLRTVAYNLAVTQASIDQLLREQADPALLAATASRLAELGTYSLVEPDAPTAKARQFLAASKQAGYFFTPPSVATEMAEAVIGAKSNVDKCLDPAAGTGALLAAVALAADRKRVDLGKLVGIELDELTATWCDAVLCRVRELLGASWDVHVLAEDAIENLAITASTYDAVIMNPPYGRVKFLRSFLTNAETRMSTAARSHDEQDQFWKERARQQADRYKAISTGLKLGGGRQDYQRLFLGLAVERLAAGGRLACISPASWLGDVDSTPLRARFVGGRMLEQVWVYPEDSGLFATVNQVTAVAVLEKAAMRQSFTFDVRRRCSTSDPYPIEFAAIEKFDPQRLRIPKVNHSMHTIYETLQAFPKLGGLQGIASARGELDQSLGSACIVDESTTVRLIRGDHIERFTLRKADSSERSGYVDPTKMTLEITGRKADASRHSRIVGRQVSYMNKPRRLSWAIVPSGVVVGNSCNYIIIDRAESTEDHRLQAALLGVLNSVVLEWYFRVFNSNNHVANYEIDELPVCVDRANIDALATASEFLTVLYNERQGDSRAASRMEDCLDALVAHSFGLSPYEAEAITNAVDPGRGRRVRGMVRWLGSHGIVDAFRVGSGWYQHIEASLSAHDREVVSYIPQGGNWTSIPESVPSARLEQIREMTKSRGGLVRTSYYGRLRPDQPSYTIATYYNRPGNGTNIPPWENRVLTSREAARLQSFPDWYVFVSKETGVRKQVGNAVPPLLAYALGQQLRSVAGPLCVDLFAGAGGLSLGLELAGVEVVAASDNDPRAAATYSFNRACESVADPTSHDTLFLELDLSHEAARLQLAAAVKEKLSGRHLDLLVGGPPCQGFSHAGWRLPADTRNDLAAAFLELAELLAPTVVVLENVDGLLSYGKGQVVRELLAAMRELGYDTGDSPWLLNAECYGVPQMRRRVFLVGSKAGPIVPPKPLFQKCRGRREASDAATLFADGLPYPMTAGDALWDLPRLSEVIHPELGARPIRHEFARWARDEVDTPTFLDTVT